MRFSAKVKGSRLRLGTLFPNNCLLSLGFTIDIRFAKKSPNIDFDKISDPMCFVKIRPIVPFPCFRRK